MTDRDRARVGVARVMCALALACVVTAMPARSRADAQGDGLKTTFAIDDADPESKVPSEQDAMRAPLQMGYWVMLVSDRAEAATKRGDLPAAVKYYRAIAKAAPDRAAPFKKMCTTYEAMDDWENAVGSCQVALGKQGATIDDYQHFMRLLLSKQGALNADEIADADAVVEHVQVELAKQSQVDAQHRTALTEQLKCQIGARLEDSQRLEGCARALRTVAPNDSSTFAFAFALALTMHDLDEAAQQVASAKRAGMNDAGLALMQKRLDRELARTPMLSRLLARLRRLWHALS